MINKNLRILALCNLEELSTVDPELSQDIKLQFYLTVAPARRTSLGTAVVEPALLFTFKENTNGFPRFLILGTKIIEVGTELSTPTARDPYASNLS